MAIKLFWSPQTRASRAVWLLEEAGVDYELAKIDLSVPPGERGAEFLRASPMGKVPALIDGEVLVSESSAIALYIADRYPERGLAPAIDSPLRGQFLYWMFYAPGVIEPAMAEKVAKLEPNRGSHGWGDFDTMIQVMEAQLDTGPWLLGELFSAADIMVGSSVAFMRMFKMLPDSAVLSSYADRCTERPGYKKAMSLG